MNTVEVHTHQARAICSETRYQLRRRALKCNRAPPNHGMKLTIRSGGTGHGACSGDLCWPAMRLGRRLGRLQLIATLVPRQAPRPFGRLSVGLQSKPPANRPNAPSAPRSLSLRWTDLPHRLVQSALPRSAQALTSCQSWLLKAVCPYARPHQESVGEGAGLALAYPFLAGHTSAGPANC